MQQDNEKLRQIILQIAAQEQGVASSLPSNEMLGNRPIFLMAPLSYTGIIHGQHLAEKSSNLVAAVDDQSQQHTIHGAPRWSTNEFLEKIKKYPDALALDFSRSPIGKKYVAQLCDQAKIERISIASQIPPVVDNFENRPVFFLSPLSFLAEMHAKGISMGHNNVIASIDDSSSLEKLHGAPCWSSRDFLQKAAKYPDAIAIDFSFTSQEQGVARKLCELAGIERINAGLAIAHYGQHAVYEPAHVYRQQTLLRLDDFLRLADRLDDDLSVHTLYSNLLFRLTYDRDYLHSAWSTPANEYFAAYGDTSTFQLGTREHFCDCGAFQGPVVQKFLEASNYRYESITAFEPDRQNFEKLQGIASACTPGYRAINKAVSNRQETLFFKETGTVASHISPSGEIPISTVRLDDEMEKLTLLKMDIEGFEAKALQGASRLIRAQRPRMAICVYHYALDLLDVMEQLDGLVENYHFRLRQHCSTYYYDLVLYASPVPGSEPSPWVQ
ncbi:FkbM family methyltransferase [Delftia acidovorans]|jgi:FkbM family methyltransferase